MKLREYQEEAVSAVIPWLLENEDKNGLIVLPTGTGKSFVIAEMIRRFTLQFEGLRVIVATHVADLVEQNYKEYLRICPLSDCGIFSAGLKQRNTHSQIIFAGIQSVYNKIREIDKCDLLIVDEAHTIPQKDNSMWGKFITNMRLTNPNMRVVGLTATDYRMDSGNLCGGDNPMFHGIIYKYDLLRAVQEGYLANVITRDTPEVRLSVEGVKKRGGDFIESELQAAVDKDSLNESIAEDIVEKGKNRRTWMVFATGVDHCTHLRDAIRSRGVSCEMVVGDTPQEERENIYKRMKAGELRCAVSVKVMTTGTNIPCIDLIADCAPTESAGLHVQKYGRGMRPIYKAGMPLSTAEERILAQEAGGKPNCLALDYAQNIFRHGPLDQIKGKTPSKGDGLPPMRTCDNTLPDGMMCMTVFHAAKTMCPSCGKEYPREMSDEIKTTAAHGAVLSNQKVWKDVLVNTVTYAPHSKGGKTPTLRVTYITPEFEKFSEWICLEHPNGSYPRNNAILWWGKRMAGVPPKTIQEIFDQEVNVMGKSINPLLSKLKKPKVLRVEQDGKFWKVKQCWFEGKDLESSLPEDEQAQKANPSESGSYDELFA